MTSTTTTIRTRGRRGACWGGNSGSLTFLDRDGRLAVGFAPNRSIEDRYGGRRRVGLLRASSAALAA